MQLDTKRKAEESTDLVPVDKKPKNDVSVLPNKTSKTPSRSSSLFAPIMLLTGHESEIFCCKFNPEGDVIASGGNDRVIFLWATFGECDNLHTMRGHSGAITELKFSTDGERIYTSSVDKTVAIWDINVGDRIKKLKGHAGFINTLDVARRGPTMICTGSDDGTIKLWDTRSKTPSSSYQNVYQVTAVQFNDTAEQILTGGIDNDIKVWDLRKNDVLYRMRGHTDTITGMSLSPDGSYILTNAMDNTVRIWDIRPYAPQERCVKLISGHQHTFEKNLLHCCWSPDGSKISAGSGDRFVYIWDTTSRRILYKLPGHAGSVNETVFHPTEPIIMSCSSDKKIYLGEIE